jgi:hypothetical protein
MITISRNDPPTSNEIGTFSLNVEFKLPEGFIEFFSQSDGGLINGENIYIELWPLTEMIELNKNYEVNKYAPGYFVFGSDGGGTAYCIEKKTTNICDMQFIGMPDDVFLICKSFDEFLLKPFR